VEKMQHDFSNQHKFTTLACTIVFGLASLLVSSAFWVRIQPEIFHKVRLETTRIRPVKPSSAYCTTL